MSSGSLITLSLEELECIRDQARRIGEADANAHSFTMDELTAMREQYEAELRREAAHREDLEWRLEVALEQLRAVEPDEDLEARPITLAEATPPRGVRIAGEKRLPPPLPVRSRLGSDAGETPRLPAQINLAPLRDALLRVARRSEYPRA